VKDQDVDEADGKSEKTHGKSERLTERVISHGLIRVAAETM